MDQTYKRDSLPLEHGEIWTLNILEHRGSLFMHPSPGVSSGFRDLLQELSSYKGTKNRALSSDFILTKQKLRKYVASRATAYESNILANEPSLQPFRLDSTSQMARVAFLVAQALLNPYQVDIDVGRFASRNKSAKVKHSFSLGKIKEPAILLDKFGNIFMWYIPGFLDTDTLDLFNVGTSLLNGMLESSTGSTWRDQHFRPSPKGFIKPGALNISPSWFPQGHGGYNPNEARMVPSVHVRDDRCSPWVAAAKEWEWLVNYAVMLIASRFHRECSMAIARVKARQEDLQPKYIQNVRDWPSIFSGISVICNRETPGHIDNKGYDPAFDVLLAGGTYKTAWLVLEEIGGEFFYPPGTFVALNGRVFKHAVDDWDEGDRICYAHFVRDDVHAVVGCERAPWVNLSDFAHSMSDTFTDKLIHSAKRVPNTSA